MMSKRSSLALSSLLVLVGCSVETIPADTDGGSGGIASATDATPIPGEDTQDADSGVSDSGDSQGTADSADTADTADTADSTDTEGATDSADADTEGDTDGDTADTADTTDTGEPAECQITTCQGKVYQCGDCIDNDGDGVVDSADPNCWGPCDNNEDGWKGEIPGQNAAPCKMDCYFDGDSGSGNDDCYWSHSCDPLTPQASCNYNAGASIPGTQMNCAEAQATQSDECLDFCGPLTPNGCDCFGCCDVYVGQDVHTVYLGSEVDGEGSCSVENAANPELCKPCTIVEGCFRPCDPGDCELCIGQTVLPDNCDEASCPTGLQSCNPALNSSDCPSGQSCITGCCVPAPQ